MAETFREFFARRNQVAFPGTRDELLAHVMQRLADTVADWCGELARRSEEDADPTMNGLAGKTAELWDTNPAFRAALRPLMNPPKDEI